MHDRHPPPSVTAPLTRDEFVRRFTARCIEQCGFTHFSDGGGVEDYCAEVAESCYDDEDRRDEGPEVCADEDMGYWGEADDA